MSIGVPISPAEFMGSGESGGQTQYAAPQRYQTTEGYNPSAMYGERKPSPGYEIVRRQ